MSDDDPGMDTSSDPGRDNPFNDLYDLDASGSEGGGYETSYEEMLREIPSASGDMAASSSSTPPALPKPIRYGPDAVPSEHESQQQRLLTVSQVVEVLFLGMFDAAPVFLKSLARL